jgi:predicted small secreted protein
MEKRAHSLDSNRWNLEMKMQKWTLMIAACAVSLAGCNTMMGAGKDIERGGEKIQDASIKVRADWRNARDRNESEYEVARKNCANMSEDQREACRNRARAAYTARMDEARTTYRRKEMRSESDEDRREDAYEAARDKCDALRGAAEDRCVADARAQYRR